MGKIRLSTKGQIILPKKIRDAHAWTPGTEFTIEERDEGILLCAARGFPETRLEDVVGCLRFMGRPKTLAQMDRGMGKEIRRRHDRGRY